MLEPPGFVKMGWSLGCLFYVQEGVFAYEPFYGVSLSFSSYQFALHEQCSCAEINHLLLPLNFPPFLIWFSYDVHNEVVIGKLWWRGILQTDRKRYYKPELQFRTIIRICKNSDRLPALFSTL